jgi:peptidoglycan/xylan/chitin deacetylase (PgdA/CDA1 family)
MAHVSGKEAREEVLRGSEAIERVAGVAPTWFRSPRGMLNGAVLRAAADCGQHVAMWTAKPTPAMSASPDAAADSLLRDLAPGAIYLFHDGTSGRVSPVLEERRRAELPLIEAVLDRLGEQGYALRTLSELSAARTQVA